MLSKKNDSLIERFLNIQTGKLLILLNVITLFIILFLKLVLPDSIASIVMDYKYNLIIVPIVVFAFIMITRVIFGDSVYFKQFVFYASLTGFSAYAVYLSLFFGLTLFNVISFYTWVVVIAVTLILHSINKIKKPMDKLSSNLERLAEGNFVNNELSIDKYGRELAQLQTSYNTMVKNTHEIIYEMRDFSSNVQTHSEFTASLLSRSTRALEEIQSIMSRINKGTEDQSNSLQTTIIEVKNFRDQFDNKMSQISAVAKSIESITSQVNMLALNASIEAARAGEYGRGFAVVAENINQLAESAKSSLGHITSSIDNLNSDLNKSISTIEHQIKSISEISDENVSGVEITKNIINDFVTNIQILDGNVSESLENTKKLNDSVGHFKID